MYFIVYEDRPIEQPAGYVPQVKNVITYAHPLIWIDQTSDTYRRHFVTYIHFWTEVGDSEGLHCKGVSHDIADYSGNGGVIRERILGE